jgi:hypothetical protein
MKGTNSKQETVPAVHSFPGIRVPKFQRDDEDQDPDVTGFISEEFNQLASSDRISGDEKAVFDLSSRVKVNRFYLT